MIREARFEDLDVRILYALLQLRAAVFVVEQQCPYQDLDGRDREPGARHCWIEEGGVPAAYLRLLAEPRGARIGRVVTALAHRGRGLAGRLVAHAVDVAPRPVVLDAQAHLVDWYTRLGFAVAGEGFLEDGIPHVPMRLP